MSESMTEKLAEAESCPHSDEQGRKTWVVSWWPDILDWFDTDDQYPDALAENLFCFQCGAKYGETIPPAD